MVIERFAKKGARVVGTGAGAAGGSFLGGILGNPIVAIVLLALGGLLIFRKDISGALSNFKLPSLPSLPDITFPSLPDITFPTFEFPTFEFPSFDFEFPSFDFDFPDFAGGASDFFSGLQSDFDQFIMDSQTNLDTLGEGAADIFGGAGEAIGGGLDFLGNAIFGGGGGTPKDLTLDDQFDDSGLEGIDLTPKGVPPPPFRDAEMFAEDFPEVFKAEPQPVFLDPVLNLESEFTGGGPSFIGGSITETPTCNLSLFQIIDKFGVTASQAADIKARACDDFGDFDFGTNTGSGIFGTPEPLPSTQGLSAREISRLITQGLLPPQFLS